MSCRKSINSANPLLLTCLQIVKIILKYHLLNWQSNFKPSFNQRISQSSPHLLDLVNYQSLKMMSKKWWIKVIIKTPYHLIQKKYVQNVRMIIRVKESYCLTATYLKWLSRSSVTNLLLAFTPRTILPFSWLRLTIHPNRLMMMNRLFPPWLTTSSLL